MVGPGEDKEEMIQQTRETKAKKKEKALVKYFEDVKKDRGDDEEDFVKNRIKVRYC